jgi:SynChlorMet cassette protein ScmC
MDIHNPTLNHKNGYCLRLANGQGWYILGIGGVGSWVKKWASILELKACEQNGSPKLVLFQRGSPRAKSGKPIWALDASMVKDLPMSGWKSHNFGALTLWSNGEAADAICEIGPEELPEIDIIRMWQSLDPIYQRAQDAGGLPLHAALVERGEMGVLLVAPGGGGKSTCCGRLPASWRVLCDDETLIVCDNQKKYFAHPFPTWSDYLWRRSARTWDVQQFVSLRAIFFLEKAETDEVVPAGRGKAAILINQSATQVCQRCWISLPQEEARGLKKRLFGNACELARAVPTYILRVSLTGRFWEKIEGVIRQD